MWTTFVGGVNVLGFYCVIVTTPEANTIWKFSNTNMNTWHYYKYECEYQYTQVTDCSNMNAITYVSIHECIHEYWFIFILISLSLANIYKNFHAFNSIYKNKCNPFNVSPFPNRWPLCSAPQHDKFMLTSLHWQTRGTVHGSIHEYTILRASIPIQMRML